MAKPSLSMSDVRKVEKTLITWQCKLGWETLVKHLKESHGITTTRQTLCTYKSIAGGFADAKDRLRGIPKAVKKSPNVTLKQAELIQTIDELRLDNGNLEKQNALLKGMLNAINCESETNPVLKEVLRTVRSKYLSSKKQ